MTWKYWPSDHQLKHRTTTGATLHSSFWCKNSFEHSVSSEFNRVFFAYIPVMSVLKMRDFLCNGSVDMGNVTGDVADL